MAQKTFTQLLAELNFYDFVGKLRILFTKLNIKNNETKINQYSVQRSTFNYNHSYYV